MLHRLFGLLLLLCGAFVAVFTLLLADGVILETFYRDQNLVRYTVSFGLALLAAAMFWLGGFFMRPRIG